MDFPGAGGGREAASVPSKGNLRGNFLRVDQKRESEGENSVEREESVGGVFLGRAGEPCESFVSFGRFRLGVG